MSDIQKSTITIHPAQAILISFPDHLKAFHVPPNADFSKEGCLFISFTSFLFISAQYDENLTGLHLKVFQRMPFDIPQENRAYTLSSIQRQGDVIHAVAQYGNIVPLTTVLRQNLQDLLPQCKGEVLAEQMRHAKSMQGSVLRHIDPSIVYLGDYASKTREDLARLNVIVI